MRKPADKYSSFCWIISRKKADDLFLDGMLDPILFLRLFCAVEAVGSPHQIPGNTADTLKFNTLPNPVSFIRGSNTD